MARVLREGRPFPALRGTDAEAVRRYVQDLANFLSVSLREIGQAVNEELLVRTNWIQSIDEDRTAKRSDRVLLVFPSTDRTITLRSPLEDTDPQPITIRHAGSANTVTVDAGASTIDGAASVALAAGESRTVVPLRQKIVDETGVGSVGWYTIAAT